MNYNEAVEILELPKLFDKKILRHNYYVKALEYHPDKNKNNDNSKEKFQSILDAYNYLKEIKMCDEETEEEDEIGNEENNYMNILDKFINIVIKRDIDTETFISLLSTKYSEIKEELLNQFSREILIKIEKFLYNYGKVLHINPEIINRILDIIKEKTKNDKTIIINPTLSNLINDEIYRLDVKNDTFCVPMWHHELVYDISYHLLIIQCKPTLPDYMKIDEYNNIYLNISVKLKTILESNIISINIEDKIYTIPVTELYIRRYQRYKFKYKGIAQIDTDDIYNIKKRSNIYVDICLIDIN